MNPLTFRAIRSFPAELQHRIRAHRYGDIDDLVQQVGLALVQAKSSDTMRAIFNRARAANRRFSQDLAHYGRSLDSAADVAADAAGETGTGVKRKQFRAQLEADLRLPKRDAQRAIKRQIERAEQGDLFGGDGSGDDGKGVPA